jgi:hypothetical protein
MSDMQATKSPFTSILSRCRAIWLLSDFTDLLQKSTSTYSRINNQLFVPSIMTTTASPTPFASVCPVCRTAKVRTKYRPRTRLERFIEPFVCAIIGAQYGFIFFVLGGSNVWLNITLTALLFFVVDLCWLRFFETEAKEIEKAAR